MEGTGVGLFGPGLCDVFVLGAGVLVRLTSTLSDTPNASAYQSALALGVSKGVSFMLAGSHPLVQAPSKKELKLVYLALSVCPNFATSRSLLRLNCPSIGCS